MPTFSITTTPAEAASGDILVIPVDPGFSRITELFSKEVASRLQGLAKQVGFVGQLGQAEIMVAPAGLAVSFVALVGIGNGEVSVAAHAEGVRRGVATAIIDGRAHMIRRIHVAMPNMELLSATLEAAFLTDYWFDAHSAQIKQDKKARSLLSLTIHVRDKKDVAVGKAAVKHVEVIMKGVSHTRDLVNQPASHMSPKVLVQEARAIAKKSPNISLTVFNRAQSQAKKFFAFLSVARGSAQEPYAIHLKYVPKKKAKKKLVLIGKGITFDSGGLSLKPGPSMETMKIDMAGAATVLGLFSILPSLNVDVEVHGMIFACENMPSGDAYRPGDVIESMSGKTIEVLNTDAEGRVTLADALWYASSFQPDAIVDLATLTGACVVALGETQAGLFGNSKALNGALMRAAEQSGEGLVEFPLPEEYRPTVQSRVADVRNTSMMKTGGAITAALFLQEFVGKSKATGKHIPWAHLDIAGPVYAELPLIPYWQFGGTGYGVRTLVNLLTDFNNVPSPELGEG